MGDLKNFSKLQVSTRSSHSEVFCKKMFLKILQISQNKRLCCSPFFKKAAGGNLKLSEAAIENVLLKKVFLKRRTGVSEPAVHTSSTQNRCFWTIHAVLRACNFINEDSNTGAFP